jgi:hypothetical protein
VIVKCHTALCDTLGERLKTWHKNQKIGDVFLEETKFIKLYTYYVNNFNASCTTLQSCRATNVLFQRFVEEAEKEDAMKGLALESYLIMPVQRIPRYVLLFQDLLNATDKSHPDYNNIEGALTRVKNFADYINKSKRNSENREQIKAIQQRVQHCDLLYQEGLEYIKDDFLRLKMKKKLRDVHFYLFNSSILITKENKKRKEREKTKEGLEVPVCVLPLATTGITSTPILRQNTLPTSFHFISFPSLLFSSLLSSSLLFSSFNYCIFTFLCIFSFISYSSDVNSEECTFVLVSPEIAESLKLHFSDEKHMEEWQQTLTTQAHLAIQNFIVHGSYSAVAMSEGSLSFSFSHPLFHSSSRY